MRHGTKIVDLSRLDIGDDGDEVGGIAQVSVVKKDLDSSLVTVSVNVIDTTSVEARGTTDNTVDLKSNRIVEGGGIERIARMRDKETKDGYNE